MSRPGDVVAPDRSAQRHYDEMGVIHVDLTAFTASLFPRMAAFGG